MGDFEDDFSLTIRVGTNATTCMGRVIDLTSQFLDAIKEDCPSYSDKKVLAALLRQRASDFDDNPIPF